jgi:hypothetical protein
MRKFTLASSITALLGAAAMAQTQNTLPGGTTAGSASSPTISLDVGSAGATVDGPPNLNRVYTLPPEVDVDVTGSINPRSCVGETMGRRICQDMTAEAAR